MIRYLHVVAALMTGMFMGIATAFWAAPKDHAWYQWLFIGFGLNLFIFSFNHVLNIFANFYSPKKDKKP